MDTAAKLNLPSFLALLGDLGVAVAVPRHLGGGVGVLRLEILTFTNKSKN